MPTFGTAIRRYFTINVLQRACTLPRKALRIHTNFMLSYALNELKPVFGVQFFTDKFFCFLHQ